MGVPGDHQFLVGRYRPRRGPGFGRADAGATCSVRARVELNAEPGRVGCRGLIAKQAAIRLRQGLNTPAGAELERLQAIALGWSAIQMWAAIGPSPDPNWRSKDTWQAENATYIAAAAAA